MHRIFPYISTKGGEHGLYRPQIEFRNEDVFEIGSARVERVMVEHGFPCCGYVISSIASDSSIARPARISSAPGAGRLAYVSDCHEIPEASLTKLKGVDTLVLNCLREREHPTHLTLAAALGYIECIAPRRAYLIHMCHDFSHEEWLGKLPKGVEPAYDGLEIEV